MLQEAASRRPDFELVLTEVQSSQDRSAAFRIGVKNVGSVDAKDAVITVMAPDDALVLISPRSDFGGETNYHLEPTSEYFAGVPSPAYAWLEVTVRRVFAYVTYVRVQPSSLPATVPVRVIVGHPDSEEVSRVITLDVS
jgi:hypothetical protein